MSPLSLAMAYMDVFYEGKALEELHLICAKDMVFEGPFFQATTAEVYISSLQADPPIGCSYELIRTFESEGAAVLIYLFRKGNIEVKMSQLFEVRSGKISRILI